MLKRIAPLTLALALVPAGVGARPAATKTAKLAKKITKKVANGRYVGTRGDGESVDWLFCANGKFSTNTGGGTIKGKKWKIVEPKAKKDGFVAIIKGGSAEYGIAKRGSQWKVGYTSFDEVKALGDVERTGGQQAAELCAAL